MASDKNSSILTPREITKTGKLAADVWLVGTVVRVREHDRDTQDVGKSQVKGKGQSKGKGGTKSSDSAPQNHRTMEIHLNGGNTIVPFFRISLKPGSE